MSYVVVDAWTRPQRDCGSDGYNARSDPDQSNVRTLAQFEKRLQEDPDVFKQWHWIPVSLAVWPGSLVEEVWLRPPTEEFCRRDNRSARLAILLDIFWRTFIERRSPRVHPPLICAIGMSSSGVLGKAASSLATIFTVVDLPSRLDSIWEAAANSRGAFDPTDLDGKFSIHCCRRAYL